MVPLQGIRAQGAHRSETTCLQLSLFDNDRRDHSFTHRHAASRLISCKSFIVVHGLL